MLIVTREVVKSGGVNGYLHDAGSGIGYPGPADEGSRRRWLQFPKRLNAADEVQHDEET